MEVAVSSRPGRDCTVVEVRGALAFDTEFKDLRDDGGSLCLAAPRPLVRTALAVTSVDRAITVYDTVQAAEDDASSHPR
jgi:hypothetical protein